MRTAAHPYVPHTCSAWLELESLSRPPLRRANSLSVVCRRLFGQSLVFRFCVFAIAHFVFPQWRDSNSYNCLADCSCVMLC